MENNKQVQKLLKGANGVLIATDNGVGVVGEAPAVLTMYSMLTRNLASQLPKELIEDAFKKGFKEPKELLKDLKDLIDDIQKKMGE
jgi:hypothetical protein